jgi:hypothetical protein
LGERYKHDSGALRGGVANVCQGFHVIASEAKQSILSLRGKMDCFVEPVIGRR